jgi:hypothetical protein
MCNSYIGNLAILAAIISIVKNIKNKYIEVALTFLLFLPISVVGSFNNLYSPIAVISPLITCVVYVFLYRYLYKHDIVLITLTIGTLNIMESFRGIALNQYPTLRFSIVISILITMCLTIYIYKALRRNFGGWAES